MEEEERKNKHREYLKVHEGLRYLVNATQENVKKKWLSDYSDDRYNEGINLCEVGPKELVIEFDEKSKDGKTSKKKQRKQWIKETIKKLKEDKIGLELYKFIGGKCPHIHLELNREATKEEKEKPSLNISLAH